jgi:hypothetical protein
LTGAQPPCEIAVVTLGFNLIGVLAPPRETFAADTRDKERP